MNALHADKKKKIFSIKTLAKKVKVKGFGPTGCRGSGYVDPPEQQRFLHGDRVGSAVVGDMYMDTGSAVPRPPPAGFLAVYVGEEQRRFVVPTGFLGHPLFKMLLEKAQEEYGFEQRKGLTMPCSVSTFRQVVSAAECNNGAFDMRNLVDEFSRTSK